MVTINAHQLLFSISGLRPEKIQKFRLTNTVLMNIAHIKYFSSKLNKTFSCIKKSIKQFSKTVLILSIRLSKKYHKKNKLKIYFSDLH